LLLFDIVCGGGSMVVYVVGEVCKFGVYELFVGLCVIDVVDCVGGVSFSGVFDLINLVVKFVDG